MIAVGVPRVSASRDVPATANSASTKPSAAGRSRLGAKPPEGIYLVLSRLGTAYYFIHFLVILPVLGRYEKTDPLPQSISDPVLDKPGMLDKFKKAAAEYEGENVGSFK